jgi:hypothetical protein
LRFNLEDRVKTEEPNFVDGLFVKVICAFFNAYLHHFADDIVKPDNQVRNIRSLSQILLQVSKYDLVLGGDSLIGVRMEVRNWQTRFLYPLELFDKDWVIKVLIRCQ